MSPAPGLGVHWSLSGFTSCLRVSTDVVEDLGTARTSCTSLLSSFMFEQFLDSPAPPPPERDASFNLYRDCLPSSERAECLSSNNHWQAAVGYGRPVCYRTKILISFLVSGERLGMRWTHTSWVWHLGKGLHRLCLPCVIAGFSCFPGWGSRGSRELQPCSQFVLFGFKVSSWLVCRSWDYGVTITGCVSTHNCSFRAGCFNRHKGHFLHFW